MNVNTKKTTMLTTTVSILVAVVALQQHLVAGTVEGTSIANVRTNEGNSYNVERQLWGSSRQWSWSNLLFHIGICQADSSCPNSDKPKGPLGCGCPDCTKPHPPHFQNDYCENLSSIEEEGEEAEGDEDVITTSESTETASSTGGGSQNASRIFSPLALFAAAAAIALLGVAFLMPKRNRDLEEDDKAVPFGPNDTDAQTQRTDEMSLSGISTAFGTVLVKMGLAPTPLDDNKSTMTDMNNNDDYFPHNIYDDDDASVNSVKNAVSTRMSLMDRGITVPPVYPDHPTPSFIPIQINEGDGNNQYQSMITQTADGGEEIEVQQDDLRPSTVVPNHRDYPSTPYSI